MQNQSRLARTTSVDSEVGGGSLTCTAYSITETLTTVCKLGSSAISDARLMLSAPSGSAARESKSSTVRPETAPRSSSSSRKCSAPVHMHDERVSPIVARQCCDEESDNGSLRRRVTSTLLLQITHLLSMAQYKTKDNTNAHIRKQAYNACTSGKGKAVQAA